MSQCYQSISNLIKILCVIVLCLSLWACSRDKSDKSAEVIRPVKTMVIGDPTATLSRSFPGKVKATKEAVLAFRVPGQLIELRILEGQKVKKGQLLARLDPLPYQDKVNETKAKYVLAKAELERYAKLLPQGHVTRSAYDIKKANYGVDKANYENAVRDLSYTYLKAAFAGLVAKKFVENFEYVRAKQQILSLQDISYIDITVDIPESVMVYVRDEGEEDTSNVRVEFESVPGRSFPVTYKEHATAADPDTQTYRVVMKMPAPKGINILPGMTATLKVNMASAQGKDLFLIPSSAVFTDEDGKQSVWVVDPKTMQLHKRQIKTRGLTGDQIEVTQGLKIGDRIVTAGVHFLREDMTVRIADTQNPKGN